MSKKEITAVYMIENLITGKVYFGRSQNYSQRKKSHLYAMASNYTSIPKRGLFKDYAKYGKENFAIKIIKTFYGECSYRDSGSLERLLIYFFYNSGLPIYNEDIFIFAKKWERDLVDNYPSYSFSFNN